MQPTMRRALAIVAIAATATAHASGDWVSEDKALHFGVSATLAAFSYGAAASLDATPLEKALWGAGVPLAVGAAKEGFDALGAGTPDWSDMGWNALGAATGLVLSWGIECIATSECFFRS